MPYDVLKQLFPSWARGSKDDPTTCEFGEYGDFKGLVENDRGVLAAHCVSDCSNDSACQVSEPKISLILRKRQDVRGGGCEW